MELVTPNEASTINEVFERANNLKQNEGCRHTQRKASVEKFFKPFPKKNQRQEEGAALESKQEPRRALGNGVAFSQYAQLDIIGGG